MRACAHFNFTAVSDMINACLWPASAVALWERSRSSFARSSASENGDEIYSNSENVFAFALYGAPSETFQSSAGWRLSRIF